MAQELTDQQKRFKLLSIETKSIIKSAVEKLTTDVVESTYLAQCEVSHPNNDVDFWEDNESLLVIAQEYIIATLEGETDE